LVADKVCLKHIWIESHRLFERIDGLVLLLFLAGGVMVNQVGCLGLLLLVGLRIPVHVQPAHGLGVEHGFEVLLELLAGQVLEQCTLLVLAIPDVLMRRELAPVTGELREKIKIFLAVYGQHRVAYLVELLVGKL